jgi:predicted enzyme related to lactoylglutathione lyase
MNYKVVKVGDVAVGGIMPIPPQAEETPPNWGGYVTVDDVDATARMTEELRAKILAPLTDIANVDRFFVLQDPQGVVISAITYAMNE